MLRATENSAGESAATRRTGADRKPESLDGARTRFARLLRARIVDKERELAALRAELSALGGEKPAASVRTVTCAVCGRPGHTKRTCPQGGSGKDTQGSPIRA